MLLNLNGGGPDAINIDLQGSDLEQLKLVAAQTMQLAGGLWPETVVYSAPDLSAGEAELRIYPREQRLSLAAAVCKGKHCRFSHKHFSISCKANGLTFLQ